MALCPGLPGWAGTRKVKPIWILLKQETVSGSGIRWAICNSAPRCRQIKRPAPHHSAFYRPDALPAAQPTASKHSRQEGKTSLDIMRQEMTGFWDGSGISWTICKQSAPRFRQITTPTHHYSVFYRPDTLPDTQPAASKH